MKNYQAYLLLILIIFSSYSCVSAKYVIGKDSVLKDDLKILDGIYENTPADYVDAQRGEPLYDLFFNQSKKYNWVEMRQYGGKIRLEALSNKKLKVEYLLGDSVAESKTVKGKIRGNYFVMGRKIFGIPFFPLVWAYREKRYAIGMTEYNYLQTIKGEYGIGGIPFFIADNKSRDYSYFKNTAITKDIHTRTIELYKNLAEENNGIPIFYKTEIYSINSLVWYHQDDSIKIYQITPKGETFYAVKNNSEYNNSNIDLSIKRVQTLDNDRTLLGYIVSTPSGIQQYWVNMSMGEAACYPYGKDAFMDIMKEDLHIMKNDLEIYLPYYYCLQ